MFNENTPHQDDIGRGRGHPHSEDDLKEEESKEEVSMSFYTWTLRCDGDNKGYSDLDRI